MATEKLLRPALTREEVDVLLRYVGKIRVGEVRNRDAKSLHNAYTHLKVTFEAELPVGDA